MSLSSELGTEPTVNAKLTPRACRHCGLAIPTNMSGEFCCSGCEVVFSTIAELGLSSFYKLRDASGIALPKKAAKFGSKYQYLNDPAYCEKYVIQSGPQEATLSFELEGVHCAACVWLIERLPQVATGVLESRLDFTKALVRVRYNPTITKPSEIAQRIASLGYGPHPPRQAEIKTNRSLLIQIGIAAFCAGNTSMLATSLYQSVWTGIEVEYELYLKIVSFLLALPCVFYSAWPFHRTAIASLRARQLHIDLPISLGILLSFIASSVNLFRPGSPVYFESVCMLVFLLLSGRWLLERSVAQARQSSAAWHQLIPESVLLYQNGQTTEVLTETLSEEMEVLIGTNERIAVDGEVISGTSSIDRSVITGESRPLLVSAGSEVSAGALNLSGPLRVRVKAAGNQTRIGTLLQGVEEGQTTRAPIVELTNKISGVFVLAVILVSISTFAFWYSAGFNLALDHTLAFLVISCPCALALAAPIALSVAIARAGRAGIVIRSADVIERATTIKQVIFDKTGTLTEGYGASVKWTSEIKFEQLACIVGALEKEVDHPVAWALLNSLPKTEQLIELRSKEIIPGQGVKAQGLDNKIFYCGSINLMRKIAVDIPPDTELTIQRLLAEGSSVIGVSEGSRLLAFASLGDRLKESAQGTVKKIYAHGRSASILSGDADILVKHAGRALGIPEELCLGEMDPEAKSQYVRRAENKSPACMVGDGVNDAAALAAASIGVGLRGGIEACLSAASVFIVDADIKKVPMFFAGADRTIGIIKLNLVLSLVYNIVGGAAAVMGLINPVIAAVLMPLSSLTVVLTATAYPTFGHKWK